MNRKNVETQEMLAALCRESIQRAQNDSAVLDMPFHSNLTHS